MSTIAAAICASLQSTSAALASVFKDPIYLQAVMSGQGAIGWAVAVTQFLSALRTDSTKNDNYQQTDGDRILSSSATFFMVSLAFTLFAGLTSWVLFNLPLYERVMEHTKDPDQVHRSDITFTSVDKKIRNLGLSIAFIYTVTIGLFPAVTSSITSIDVETPLLSPLLFTSFGFIVFNSGDWIGRALPGFKAFVFTNKRGLVLATAARIIFIVSPVHIRDCWSLIEIPYRP